MRKNLESDFIAVFDQNNVLRAEIRSLESRLRETCALVFELRLEIGELEAELDFSIECIGMTKLEWELLKGKR